jgi:hypothetical protein
LDACEASVQQRWQQVHARRAIFFRNVHLVSQFITSCFILIAAPPRKLPLAESFINQCTGKYARKRIRAVVQGHRKTHARIFHHRLSSRAALPN